MIKFLIFIILTIPIIYQKTASLPVCNLDTAKLAIAPRIFAEQTIDGKDQPIFITRFLHNKIGIYGSEFGRCYTSALDLNFINHSLTPIGIIALLYFIFKVFVSKRFLLIFPIILVPLAPAFNIPVSIIVSVYKLFAIIGLAIFVSKSK